MIAEWMIRLDFEMQGMSVSCLFEGLQQRLAIRSGAVAGRNQKHGPFTDRGSKLQEIPFITMIKDLAAKRSCRRSCQGQEIGRIDPPGCVCYGLVLVFRLQAPEPMPLKSKLRLRPPGCVRSLKAPGSHLGNALLPPRFGDRFDTSSRLHQR